MLNYLGILAFIVHIVYSKAFGHSVEYRFEYDPWKSDRPIVEWRWRPHTQYQKAVDLRKASKGFMESDYEEIPSSTRRAMNNGWHNGSPYKVAKPNMKHKAFVDQMAAELRRRSEEIIASHFPYVPFNFYERSPMEYRQDWYHNL